MKNFEYYKMLPESLEQKVIESEIEEIIQPEVINFTAALHCIYELSDRQVINYSPISKELKEKITKTFIHNWICLPMADKSLCMEIMLNFGLQEFYDFLKAEIINAEGTDTFTEFSEIAEEFGENINDVSFRD